MEPLLRPADVLRALVLPATIAGMAAHGLSCMTEPDDSDGPPAPSDSPGSADLRLALRLGLDSLPLSERSAGSKRSSTVTGSAPRQSDSSAAARALVAEGTAGELLRALCALLDARPTAQPSTGMAGADQPSAASRRDPSSHRVPLRLVEPAIELLQRLVNALADPIQDVIQVSDGALHSDPVSGSLTQLRRRLEEVAVTARGCNWRTALQLAPLEAALSSLPTTSAAATASGRSETADGRASIAVLLVPPSLRSSCSSAQGAEHTQHFSNGRLVPSDTVKVQQAVTECLVLCAASADAASAFAEAAEASTASQQAPVQEGKQRNMLPICGQNTIQCHARALAGLVLQLPRNRARQALLAACLELLPWCTAAEYRRLAETVLPAWLAFLQRRAILAAPAPGTANRLGSAAISAASTAAPAPAEAACSGGSIGTSAGVLQLCARAASLLVRDDAPVADGGGGRRGPVTASLPMALIPMWTPVRSGTPIGSHLELNSNAHDHQPDNG